MVAFIAVCAFAGLRLGEAAALKFDDVDFLRRQLRVRRQVQRARGGQVEIRLPKYGSERDVSAARRVTGGVVAACRPRSSGRLAVRRRRGQPAHQNTVGYRWRKPHAAASQEGIRLYDLRHFYASGLIAAGCDVVTVQRALGHAKAGTTLETYIHLRPWLVSIRLAWVRPYDAAHPLAGGWAAQFQGERQPNQPAREHRREVAVPFRWALVEDGVERRPSAVEAAAVHRALFWVRPSSMSSTRSSGLARFFGRRAGASRALAQVGPLDDAAAGNRYSAIMSRPCMVRAQMIATSSAMMSRDQYGWFQPRRNAKFATALSPATSTPTDRARIEP